MPTLDEYRRKLVVRLEGCAEAAQAKTLLAEADLWLAVSRISKAGQAAFWRAVGYDLDGFRQEAALMRATQLAAIDVLARRQTEPETDNARCPALLQQGIPRKGETGRSPA